jgi:hypothetical protein
LIAKRRSLLVAAVRGFLAALAGAVFALALVGTFSVLAGFALSRDRLVVVARTALDQGDLPYNIRTNEDFFTECAALEMQYLRVDSVLRNAVETRLLQVPGEHPCRTLQTMVEGAAAEKSQLPAAVIYDHYAFGSRFLEAVVLNFVSYSTAAECYSYVSYGVIFLLFLSMLLRLPKIAFLLSPLPIFLLCAFGLHRFGQNLSHAPAFFVGIGLLAPFVAAKGLFQGLFARLAFSAALGVVTIYFDLLTGSLAVILGLLLVVNHFFYVKNDNANRSLIVFPIGQALGVAGCFVFGCVTLTVVRLGLLEFASGVSGTFGGGLAQRLGHIADNGESVTLPKVAHALWMARFQLTPGGAQLANWVLLFGFSAWVSAGLLWLAATWRDRVGSLRLTTDLLVLGIAAGGVLAWCALLPAHTYTHVLFIVRTMALPVAYGGCAAFFAAAAAVRAPQAKWLVPTVVVVAAIVGVLTLDPQWNKGGGATITAANFVESATDRVSCGAGGFRPDGTPDGVIALRYSQPRSPLEYLGFKRKRSVTNIRVERQFPPGAYESGMGPSFVLGVSRSVDGELLNSAGVFVSRAVGEETVYLHFCRDQHDTPQSIYRVSVNAGPMVAVSPE